MSISELTPMRERARRIEVFTGAGRRRNWPADEKAAIVAESYAPGRTVCGVARRHGLTPAQLFTWRRLARRSRVPKAPALVCAGRGRSRTRSAAPSCVTAAARPPARAHHGDRGGGGRHCGSDRIGREPAGDRGRDPGAEGGTAIGPTGAVRVMMATQPVDFRKGADGLAALVHETMGADPFSGAVYDPVLDLGPAELALFQPLGDENDARAVREATRESVQPRRRPPPQPVKQGWRR